MKLLTKVAAIGSLLFAAQASADVIVLDFENINTSYPHANNVLVQDFYNGGTSSAGTSGTNYGVSFSDNALNICMNTAGVRCSNGSRGGQGNPDSAKGALFFLQGSETFMNVAAGFDTGFSFFYSAINRAGSISVYDDVNGTGNLLATLALPTTPRSNCGSQYNASYCPFVAIGVSFSGIAKSVSFAGVADRIAFDDVTFGSATPDPVNAVPNPASLALFGLGLVALYGRRSKAAK